MSDVKTIDIQCLGYSVQADYYPGDDSKILLCITGWTSYRAKYRTLVSSIVEQTGMSAVVLEYSGHGESQIDLEEVRIAQHFLEVIYAFDYIKDIYPGAEITVVGTSYGGFMATQLTKYRTFKNLVLRVPAIYRPEDFYAFATKAHGPETQSYREDANAVPKHPLLARASRFKGKTLVVVHDKDEIIPKHVTDAYIKTFDADVHTADSKHGVSDMSDERMRQYQQAISDWIHKHT